MRAQHLHRLWRKHRCNTTANFLILRMPRRLPLMRMRRESRAVAHKHRQARKQQSGGAVAATNKLDAPPTPLVTPVLTPR
jgi:hypothetical protein